MVKRLLWPIPTLLIVAALMPLISYKGELPLLGGLLLVLVAGARSRFKADLRAAAPALGLLALAASLAWLTGDAAAQATTAISRVALALAAVITLARLNDPRTDLAPLPGRPVGALAVGLLAAGLAAALAIGQHPLRAALGKGASVETLNPAATVLVLLGFAVVLWLWRDRRRLSAAAAAAVITAGVLASESTAAKMGLAAGTVGVVLATVLPRNGYRAVMLMAAVAVVAVTAASLLGEAPYSAAVDRLGIALDSLPRSARHRVYIYDFVAAKSGQYPLFGWGLGMSRSIPGGDALTPMGVGQLLPSHPHNGALQMVLELGLLGLALFGYALYKATTFFWGDRGDPWRRRALAGITTAFATMTMFSYSVWASWWLASGVLAVALACWLLAAPARTPSAGESETP